MYPFDEIDVLRKRGNSVSPLMAVRSVFDRIAEKPVGLPPECVIALGRPVATWGELRAVLCDHWTPLSAVDTVWIWLVREARRSSGGQEAALGVALPMLAGMGRRVNPRTAYARHDATAQVLAAFVAAIGRVDTDRPGVWGRLRWAAWVGARAWVKAEVAAATPTRGLTAADEPAEHERLRSVVMAHPGHPELLLAQAVAEGVLDADAAGLIAATRLGKRTLTAVAAEAGQPYKRLEKRRSRAERRLALWVRERLVERSGGDIDTVEQHAFDTMARARGAAARHERARLRVVSQTPGAEATSGQEGTTRLPAVVEVNHRCA